MARAIENRIAALEAHKPAEQVTGWDKFTHNGPEDDAALAEAQARADAQGRGLIVRLIVEPAIRPDAFLPRLTS